MTGLKFYTDDSLHEWEHLQHFHSIVPVVLRCNSSNLIPFCLDYASTGEAIDDIIIEYLDGGELTLDDTSDFTIETDGTLDWIIYNGESVASGGAALDTGLARIRIELDGDSVFYSDYFEICDLDTTFDCGKSGYDNYFNLYFSAEHDMPSPYNIVYQTGYENHHIFDTLPVRPESRINIEGETDESQDEAITFMSHAKIYQVEIIGGQSLFDILRILPMHEHIYIKWPCEDLREVKTIEFEHEWFDEFLCRMTLKFSFVHLIKTNCDTDYPVSDVSPLIDKDGNEYSTVRIGDQEWTVEPLKTTTYADGTAIPEIQNQAAWDADPNGAYCWYDNDSGYKNPYGALYNKYAVDNAHGLVYFTRNGVHEPGWRVPSATDFDDLIAEITGDFNTAGGPLKDTGTDYWNAPNTGATDLYGFWGIPGGVRNISPGTFANMGNYALYWTTTNTSGTSAKYYLLYHNNASMGNISYDRNIGCSIKCVRDI